MPRLARLKPRVAPRPPEVLVSLQETCSARGLGMLAERLRGLEDFICEDLSEIEAELARVPVRDDIVGKSGHHLLERGGKRLRPLCVGLASRLGVGFSAATRELAVAAELVHNATLLHDDVVDLGDRRRGQETARLVYGNAASIFAGDWLLIEALRRVHATNLPDVLVRLLEVIDEMIRAEALQLGLRGALVSDRRMYFRVIEGKTASLFRWATFAGARAGCLGDDEATRVASYGADLGIAFQIIDDALDLRGDTAITGKDRFTDLLEGKITHPLLVLLEIEPETSELLEVLALGRDDHETRAAKEEIFAALDRTRAIDTSVEVARDYARRACLHLEVLPNGPARGALEAVCEAMVLRDR